MRRLADFCFRRRRTVLACWLAALVAIGALAGGLGTEFRNNFDLPASDSQKALDLLEKRFPAQSGDTETVVLHATGGRLDQPDVAAQAKRMFDEVRELPHVVSVSDPLASDDGSISQDGTIAFSSVRFDKSALDLGPEAFRDLISTAQSHSTDRLQVEVGGPGAQMARDGGGNEAEVIGLIAAMIVLLITFGSVVAMGLPIVTALIALGIGMGLVTVSTHVFDVSAFTPALATMIGLGVGIDYALFIVTRYRACLAAGLQPRDAVATAMDTAGRAVLFAGTTVVISMMGMFALGIGFLHGPAVAASLAVALTMFASLTLMPALLGFAGARINRLRIPGLANSKPDGGRAWVRWSRIVTRRPWLSMLASLGVLLALSVPVLSIQLGTADAGSDPAGSTTRQAYDLLAEGFGPGFNGPLQVVSVLPDDAADHALAVLETELKAQPGVQAVTPPVTNPQGDTAVMNVYPATSPQDVETKRLVDRIRDDVVPLVRGETGLDAHVGGPTAIFDDFADYMVSKLPLFIGVVVALSALLLMAVFRSVLVPVKAILMNLLSLSACFGVVVAIFQWGWLAGPLGVDVTAPIQAFLPVMVFAIVFGLSMDYEVFLMARIHEEWERRRDASAAVEVGLASTGRVITAAATIMIAVFAAFALGDELTIKLFGIALAVAVFLDAVVIRTVLVPAILEILGPRAWWLPAWMDRLLPRLNVEGQPDTPAANDPEPVNADGANADH